MEEQIIMKRNGLVLLVVLSIATFCISPAVAQSHRAGGRTAGIARPSNAVGRPGPGNWGGRNWNGHRHYRHHSNFYFGVGLGYPFGYGYPYYGYPYDNSYPYDSGYYSRRVVYEGAPVASDGSVVVAVQRRLARAGYYHGSIDGVAGNQTRRAIRAYERTHGLPADGQIDDELLASMGLG